MGKIETEHNVNDHWGTPEDVYGPMVEHFGEPGLDPFWNPTSEVPAKRMWTDWKPNDGFWFSPDGQVTYEWRPAHCDIEHSVNSFDHTWDGHGLVFVNGPFSKAQKYLKKCGEEGDEVIFLFKTNMNAKYIHKFVKPCDAVAFFDHRLTYVGAKWQATFHTGLGYWGTRPELFDKAYQDQAWVVLRGEQ